MALDSGKQEERPGDESILLKLLNRTMPLNVEERFWTATVLPALVAAPNLEPLGPLLDLLRERAGALARRAPYDPTRVLFFTEYDRRKSNGTGCGRSLTTTDIDATPDVLIVELGDEPMIYGIEAKVAGCVNSVRWQRVRQTRFVLNALQRDIEKERGGPVAKPVHVALVPEQRQRALEAQRVPVINWTEIRELTTLPSTDYFVQCLDLMIASYEKIAKGKAKLCEGEYTGRQLRWLARRDAQFRPKYVGIGQGAKGSRLREVLESGDWKRTHFQANWTFEPDSPPNGNWMRYEEFLTRVSERP